MSAFGSSLQFLHSLREYDYLVQSLRDGLMFTTHQVKYAPANDPSHWQVLLGQVMPTLLGKLERLGVPFESLSEERQYVLMAGLGTMTAEMPMICFTEVPLGRDISMHVYQFGKYGIGLRREWLEEQGADRVLYVGDKTALSERLFRTLAIAKIHALHLSSDGTPLFETDLERTVIDLLAYVESRTNVEELEWRIAGKHNFYGDVSDANRRIPLPLTAVDRVFVARVDEVAAMTALVEELARAQDGLAPPIVAAHVF